MKRALVLLSLSFAAGVFAQIRVSPVTVNVNSQGASTVFLSYGSIRPDQFSAEALWCAEIVTAAPDVGFKCDPASTWGRLPLRNDLTRPSGSAGLTDIMTIPQNVIRRAYQRAERGSESSFYYVRRFSSASGLPDEYIPIICRLAGRGSKTPFALTDVKLRFATEKNVLSTPVGQAPPPLHASITYTGSGRLVGRWEVVAPGDEQPSPEDLVPEASLPVEQRSRQRRFMQVGRFNVYLPPTGTYQLEGPDVTRLPAAIEGLYQVLLRVEASDDADGNTNLSDVGSETGIVTTGGVAGFPLPVLRYYVGSAGSDIEKVSTTGVRLIDPKPESLAASGQPIAFAWEAVVNAAFYRLDVNDSEGNSVLSAIIASPATRYVAPPLTGERAVSGKLTWSVLAMDREGKNIAQSATSTFRHGIADGSQTPNP